MLLCRAECISIIGTQSSTCSPIQGSLSLSLSPLSLCLPDSLFIVGCSLLDCVERVSYPYNAKALRGLRCCCRVLFSRLHKHGQDDINTQMAINKWCGYVFSGQSILSIVILIRFYLKSQEQQETNAALDMESR